MHLTFPLPRRKRRKSFDGRDERPPRKWRNSSHFRETNSMEIPNSIPLHPSPRPRSRVTVSLWFSWNLNGVSRTFERWSKRSPLRAAPSPITVPIKGGGIEPPPFLLFLFSFAWADGCEEGEPVQQHVTRLLTSFLTSAIHSRRRRGWLAGEKHFHLDAHLVEKIFTGIYYGGDVMSPFVPRKERWYLRNKRSRLNALLAIRAINGASTLISCLRYQPPPLLRQWWVSDINTRRLCLNRFQNRSPPLPEHPVIRSDFPQQFLKKQQFLNVRFQMLTLRMNRILNFKVILGPRRRRKYHKYLVV